MRPIITAFISIFLIPMAVAMEPVKTPPNILVFIADDAGMDFGCYGNQGIRTPNIDRMAAEGLKFNEAFLTCSQCSPTRTSLLSGQFAHTIGTEDLHTPLGATTKILPSYLEEQGYFTGLMLKTHIGPHGMKQFNWYDQGNVSYRKGLWNDHVQENFSAFIEASDGKPFFMWCAFIDPHRPYGDSITGAPEVHSPTDVTVPPHLVDSKETRKDLAQYYDEIHRMDKHIGLILEELERRDLADNTLIVFFSDNGAPFPRAKATVFDTGIQTPLVIKWKGNIQPGTTYNDLVSMIDLAPTLLEASGSKIPEQMAGQSISDIFKDQDLPGRRYVFSERNWHDSDAHMRSIRSKKYKLILNTYTWLPFPISGDYWQSGAWSDLLQGRVENTLTNGQLRIFEFPRPSIELYDLENDPHELVNLNTNPAYRSVIEDLNNELLQWQIETNDLLPPQVPRRDIVDRKSGFLYDRNRINSLKSN